MLRACGLLRSGGLVAALLAIVIIPATAKPATKKSNPSSTVPSISAPQEGILRATGSGAMASASEEPNRARAYLKAKSQAKMEAITNLVQSVRGTMVRYRSCRKGQTCEEEMNQEIDGMLQGVVVVSESKRQEGKDTIVDVVVEAPNPAGAGATPSGLAAGPAAPVRVASTKLDNSILKSAAKPKAARSVALPTRTKDAAYTSVIINARGFKVKRSMAPKIVRSDGSEVWGTLKVDYDYVADHGIVGYTRSLAEAIANPRAGDNPLIIRALRRGPDPYGGDAVISDEDADYLLAENKRANFLKNFRVLFVIDESNY